MAAHALAKIAVSTDPHGYAAATAAALVAPLVALAQVRNGHVQRYESCY